VLPIRRAQTHRTHDDVIGVWAERDRAALAAALWPDRPRSRLLVGVLDAADRVMALVGALCTTLLAATGFTNKSLRALVAELLGTSHSHGQMTYDLWRLRQNGLIRRIEHANQYVLTPDGTRVAVFYTKALQPALGPAHRRRPASSATRTQGRSPSHHPPRRRLRRPRPPPASRLKLDTNFKKPAPRER